MWVKDETQHVPDDENLAKIIQEKEREKYDVKDGGYNLKYTPEYVISVVKDVKNNADMDCLKQETTYSSRHDMAFTGLITPNQAFVFQKDIDQVTKLFLEKDNGSLVKLRETYDCPIPRVPPTDEAIAYQKEEQYKEEQYQAEIKARADHYAAESIAYNDAVQAHYAQEEYTPPVNYNSDRGGYFYNPNPVSW